MWTGATHPTLWGHVGIAWNHEGIGFTVLPSPDPALTWDRLCSHVRAKVLKGSLPALWREAWRCWERGNEGPLWCLPLAGLEKRSFQPQIWLALRTIPRGQVRSYGWIATRAGSPQGARAAGQALAANPLPLLLPCHRIVRASGQLGGFSGRWGRVELKEQLLTWEGVQIKNGRVKFNCTEDGAVHSDG